MRRRRQSRNRRSEMPKGTHPRPRHLAAKLRAIRKRFGVSQSRLAKLLEFKVSYARISEYEHGVRVPSLLVLLRYSQIAGIHMETLIDDKLELPEK